MFLNVDQLEKQLDKDEFQEIGSMAAFKIQTIEDKVDSSKALDASLVDIESSGTKALEQQDTSSRSGNDVHANDADIRPIYDEEPMDETTELSNQSLESKNIRLKKTVAQFQKDFSRMEAHCVNLELKYQNQALKEGQHGKPALQPRRNQSVVREPTAFKSERPRFSKQRFASQVDVNNDLSKPVTTHYLPKERKVASAKPHHVIASSNSRNSSKNMPRFSSNDMIHNHYLEEATKKTQCQKSEEFKTYDDAFC
ncbi:hypothetical protein Tco_1274632 [Tanacetum coccineum]